MDTVIQLVLVMMLIITIVNIMIYREVKAMNHRAIKHEVAK